MYNYEWDRLRTWLSQYNAIEESVTTPQEIKRIDLRGNSLKSLPSSFSLLSNLSVLDIGRNSFEVLPEVLQNLPLLSFNASANKLIDISILGECKHIRVLDLSANALKEIKISLLPELRTLNLSSNYLKNIGDFLPSVAKVVRLNLNNNLLEHIPASIGLLQELEEIEMVDNRLQSIDEAFFQLALRKVNLSSNRFTSLELHGLTALEVLTLDENPLKRVGMSKEFAPHLRELSCDSCALEEFALPASIALETLCYASNSIQEVPKEIERYTRLCELDIEANFITDLPDTLANITTLQILYVKGNPLHPHAKKVIEILDPEICDLKMKSGITIEAAQEGDLQEMAELLGVLFAIESDFVIDYEKQYAGLRQLFAYEGSDLLVAKHENRVVGMLTMQRLISSAEGNFVGQLEDLIVKEEYRKMGVASRLINKMRAKAIAYGYKRIQLAADINNENALRFYTRRGLKRTHLSVYHYHIA